MMDIYNLLKKYIIDFVLIYIIFKILYLMNLYIFSIESVLASVIPALLIYSIFCDS